MRIQDFISSLQYRIQKKGYLSGEQQGNGGARDIAHVSLYLAGNAGDIVLSQCVRRTMMKFFPVHQWQMVPLRKPVTRETLDRMNACERIVLGGGGVFLPDSNANVISGWQWPISLEDLQAITVPLWVFSVGYNFFPGQTPEPVFLESLRALAEKSTFFGMRNRGSVEAVRALLPEKDRDKIVFQPCTTTLIRKIYGDTLPAGRTIGRIALNMAFDRAERRFGEQKEVICKNVAAAARCLQDKGYKIDLVCHVKKDADFLPWLKRAGVRTRLVDLHRKFPEQVLRYYSEIDLTIGMRGHAQMIPFGLNQEILTLGTHDKMKWFLEDIGCEDWYVNLREDPDSLTERIVNTFETIHEKNPEQTRHRLMQAQEELWRITRHNLAGLGGTSC